MAARAWHQKVLALISATPATPPTTAFAGGASVGDGEPFATVATSGLYSDMSGTISAAALPNPSASTLGGVQSYAPVSHQWINTISTSGVPSSTQPATNDLSQTTATFTPSISFATPGDVAVTYTTQSGTYWIIGNLLFWKIAILTSSFTWSTSAGDFRVNGLPFTVKNNVNSRGVGSGSFEGITKVNYTQYTPTCREGTTTMAIVASGSGQSNSNVSTANVASGGTIQLEMAGFYEMA